MSNAIHEKYIKECLRLAKQAFPYTSPNPLVGAVLVFEDKIIATGYHKQYGGAHAEADLFSKIDRIPEDSILYVNLEPCSHFGKTPPCVDAIIASNIKTVVIGTKDPNPKVSGAGIEKLKKNNITVVEGILAEECRELNKRFFVNHILKRPYIILKWAQSSDNVVGVKSIPNYKISSNNAHEISHEWRSQETALLVGTNTALVDNPKLTARLNKEGFTAKNPIRVVLDREGKLPIDLNIFNDEAASIYITQSQKRVFDQQNIKSLVLEEFNLENIFLELYRFGISSLIVEGGPTLLESCVKEDLWDEARVIVSQQKLLSVYEEKALLVKIDYSKMGILKEEILLMSQEKISIVRNIKIRTNSSSTKDNAIL